MSFPMPRRASSWRRVFLPSGALYEGTPTTWLKPGRFYADWVPNDHAFAIAPDGAVHLFGITHPETPVSAIHEGEVQLFHARCDKFPEKDFADLGNLFPPAKRPGEIPEIHSPAIVKGDGGYSMLYGPGFFRLATSPDLESWTLQGTVFEDLDGSSRDPQLSISPDGNGYLLCYCAGAAVRMRRSADLRRWSEPMTLFSGKPDVSPESPFLLHRNGVFYLFICLWNFQTVVRKVSDAYSHRTVLYAADELRLFTELDIIGELDAHAPELFFHSGRCFISSAEYPERGIQIAELEW